MEIAGLQIVSTVAVLEAYLRISTFQRLGKTNLDFGYDNDSTNTRKPATRASPWNLPIRHPIDARGCKTEKDFAAATQPSRRHEKVTVSMTQHTCTDAQGLVNADRKAQNGKGLRYHNSTEDNIKGHRHHDTTLPAQR